LYKEHFIEVNTYDALQHELCNFGSGLRLFNYLFLNNLYLIICSFQRTAEVGIYIHWESRMTLIDQIYGYRKAEEYYLSNKMDESKVIIITTEMLRDLFVFITGGSIFCFTIFFIELLHFTSQKSIYN